MRDESTVPNRKAICDVVMEEAKKDTRHLSLCSDSRGVCLFGYVAARFPGSLSSWGLRSRIWSVYPRDLRNAAKNRLRLLRPVFIHQNAMNSARLTWHT